MGSTTKWKDFLLKSGLPLENDVFRYLREKGAVPSFEYSYLRNDERQNEKQFSYDLDASYFRRGYGCGLMIECKYRHDSTTWVFTPDEYGGPEEIYETSFVHPFDRFVSRKFPFSGIPVAKFAPLCSKGIEITSSGSNEKTITQGISQLSYAFAEQVVHAVSHQVNNLIEENMI